MKFSSVSTEPKRSECAARRMPCRRAKLVLKAAIASTLFIGSVVSCIAQQGIVASPPVPKTHWQGPGGRHEFGVWWGYSGFSGDIWGASHSVTYMPIGIRYSYEFARHNQLWSLRYSPEITPYARISWLQPDILANVVTKDSPRLHTSGSGASPVGFRVNLHPLSTIQPFLSTNAGFVYFRERVLSPQGSQWMYTIDFGSGLNIYQHGNRAVTVGYRYQHLSNANISFHNPGTDANTFYFGVSRFLNKGE